MKQMLKSRSLLWVIVITVLVVSMPSQAFAEKQIEVVMDQDEVTFDVHPQIIGGRTFVPFRALFEMLDAQIRWDSTTQTVRAWQEDTTITLTIGKVEAVVNDNSIQLDVAPSVIRGRTMVPLRFITETLGKKVHWDPTERIVYLYSMPEFIIKGDEGISDQTIDRVQEMVEEEIVPYLEEMLPVIFRKKYTIKLHSSRESYGANFGDMAEYYADNTYAAARLTTIMVANYSISSESQLHEILAHELVHVAISHMGLRSKLPLWVNEGLAERLRHEIHSKQPDFVYQSKFDLISLIQAAEADKLSVLPQYYYDEVGHVDYRSYDHYEWAIRNLEEEYGYDKLVSYLVALQTDLDNEEAFTQTFGVAPAQFEEGVQERLAKLAQTEDQAFALDFTISESFRGDIILTESAKLEESDSYSTSLDSLNSGDYTLEVDPVQKKMHFIQDGEIITELELHDHQGQIFIQFEPERLLLYDRKVIEKVSVIIKYAYGRIHFGGIHIGMEHGSTVTLRDEVTLEGFFDIDQIIFLDEL
jgi:hypothetical protein